MKHISRAISAVGAVAAACCALCACAVTPGPGPEPGPEPIEPGKSELLAQPAKAERLTYEEMTSAELRSVRAAAETFAAGFASAAIGEQAGDSQNYAVSPISVYMGLSLAARCAAGETRDELLGALNVSYDTLMSGFDKLYRSLEREVRGLKNELVSCLSLGNSIWMDCAATAKSDCLTSLAENMYCYTYSADFAHDNTNANLEVRSFVKQQTRGLIDVDFSLPDSTLFTLINTLYLKDVWNDVGGDMSFTKNTYDFAVKPGPAKPVKLMQGKHIPGRAYVGNGFTSFYTVTDNGYKLKFMLPDDGRDIAALFTSGNIAAMNSVADYNGIDEQHKKKYYTRCLFPEFHASFGADVAPVLRSDFGVDKFFSPSCDFSGLTDFSVSCGRVQHITDLKVDRKGVEGAAVTVMDMVDNAAPGDMEYEEIRLDFVLDRAFGFVLTDSYDTTLFSGIVNTI